MEAADIPGQRASEGLYLHTARPGQAGTHLMNCFRTSYMTGSLSVRSVLLLSVSSISSTSSSVPCKAVWGWAVDRGQLAPPASPCTSEAGWADKHEKGWEGLKG